MFTTILMLAVQLLPTILQTAGVISPSVEALIQQLGAATAGLVTTIATGAPVADDVKAGLLALRSAVTALEEDTSLSHEALQACATLVESIDSGLAAHEQAQLTTEPETLEPLPTDL